MGAPSPHPMALPGSGGPTRDLGGEIYFPQSCRCGGPWGRAGKLGLLARHVPGHATVAGSMSLGELQLYFIQYRSTYVMLTTAVVIITPKAMLPEPTRFVSSTLCPSIVFPVPVLYLMRRDILKISNHQDGTAC